MRVLHVFKTYLPDSFTGVERVIWEIAEGTVAHGVESGVFSLSPFPGGRQAIGRHWAEAARRDLELASTGLSVSAFGAFPRLVREADLVHYHFPWPLMDVLDLVARHDRPRVVTYHSDIVKQRVLARLYAPLMHGFLGRAAAIVATSPNYLATSPVLARHRARVEVIPIGIDPDRPAAPEPAVLAAWRSRLPARFLLFVGALRYYKGIGHLIEAARLSGLPVVIAGGGTLPAELEARRPETALLLGPVDEADKAALLALATGFVFPSHLRSEAFGVALLEAAFAGKPLISCEIGTGTSHINIDGETGLVVPPADPAALAAAMTRLFADADLQQRFGAAAAARAQRLFRAETMAAAYAALYRRVLGAGK